MNFNGFKKIESIKKLQKYKMPTAQTVFIFDFKKQEKEIDNFLKNRRLVTIRSDKKGRTYFCPLSIGCPRNKAKSLIKKISSKGYAVLLQEYVPVRSKVSGNILILKKNILVELIRTGALSLMDREGKFEEQIKFKKKDLTEVSHFGKRLIKKQELINIVKMVKKMPVYNLIEFTLRNNGLYFWQIKKDKTARKLED
jgi:hypothetical protein